MYVESQGKKHLLLGLTHMRNEFNNIIKFHLSKKLNFVSFMLLLHVSRVPVWPSLGVSHHIYTEFNVHNALHGYYNVPYP
jgi:hypothetical protein